MFSKGVRFMLLATFFFAMMNVLVKLLDHLPAVEIAFFRSIASWVFTIALVRIYHVPLPGKNIPALLLRGFLGSTSLILHFIVLQHIPLASAATIQFLSPIFTAIIGIFMVKESVKPLQWVFFAIAFGGILLIQGFDTRVTWLYLSMGIVSALFAALAYNTIRMLKNSEHPLVIILYFPSVAIPVTGIFTAFQFVLPTGWDWFVLVAIGIMAQGGQYFMTRAYQSDELSKIASLKYLGIIYALVFGYFIFGETFSIQVHLGMVAVLSGVILNIWYRNKK